MILLTSDDATIGQPNPLFVTIKDDIGESIVSWPYSSVVRQGLPI